MSATYIKVYGVFVFDRTMTMFPESKALKVFPTLKKAEAYVSRQYAKGNDTLVVRTIYRNLEG